MSDLGSGPKKVPSWVPLALTAACCAVFSLANLRSASTDVAYLMGYSFSTAGIGWLIYYFTYLKKANSKAGGLHFAILFGATFAANMAISQYQQQQARVAAREIASSFEQYTTTGGAPSRDIRPKSTGEVGWIEGFFKDLMATLAKDRVDYDNEIGALGVDKFFAIDTIQSPNYFKESYAKVSKAREVVAKYKARHEHRLIEARDVINKGSLSPETRAKFVSDFDVGLAKGRPDMDRLWQIESLVLDQVDGAVTLLEKRRGQWEIQNGKLIFASDSDVAEFNGYLKRMEGLGQEQAALAKKSEEGTRASLQNMQSEAN